MRPLMLLAWFGGRSFDELRDMTAHDCGSSIAVGGLGVVSAGMIAGGQYLFWSHLPHTADAALWITALLTPLYAGFYRVAIRSLEIMGAFGKSLTAVVVAGIVGTNALLAGHEWVLLAFKPQVEAQVALDAAKGVTEYGGAVENSLGLPQLRKDSKTLDDALGVAQAERARVPEAVLTLQKQAQRCDGIAANLQAQIPLDAETMGFAAAKSAWREQHARCNATRAQADRMLRDHQKHFDNQISDLVAKHKIFDKKLGDASAEYETTLKRDTPALNASATSGFARHKALWSAVETGRVPAWAACGLMFVALALEGMCFVLKFLLPPDAATLERQSDVEQIRTLGQMRVLVAKAYRANIRSVVSSIRHQLADDVREDAQNIVVPGLRTEIAARAFDYAHDRTARAQRRAGKPAPDLLRRLAGLGGAVRGTMGPRSVGSPLRT